MITFKPMRVVAVLALLFQPTPATAQQEHFVDLGTHTLHAVVSGSGSPVVVLESGLTLGLDTWDPVRERIAEFATVIAYSRAGYGQSEPSDAPRTLTQVADELAQLLDGLDVDDPVVLVDSSHERQFHEMSFLSDTFMEDRRRGLYEYIDGPGEGPEIEELWPIYERGTAPEAYPLPDVPTVVLTALAPDERYIDASPPALDVMRRLHREFLEYSSEGWQVIAPESGHMMHEEAPTLVVETVRALVHRVGAR